VQREITPEIKKIPVGQYKWDQDSVDFYKDALLEKESVEGILPVTCPWSVVLSGYSCFFHH
jgi:hypothetical protein